MSIDGAVTLKWTDGSGGAFTLVTVDLDASIFKDPSNPVMTPVVDSVAPDSGTAGDAVMLTGSGFEAVTDVAFGGTSSPDVGLNEDAAEMSAVIPNGLAGRAVDVIATNRWGNQSAAGIQVTIS